MTVGITSAGQAEVMMHTRRGGAAMFHESFMTYICSLNALKIVHVGIDFRPKPTLTPQTTPRPKSYGRTFLLVIIL